MLCFSDISTSNTIKIDLLKILQLIVKTHEFPDYQEYAETFNKLATKAISDKFYRVCFEGMEFAQLLVKRRPLDGLLGVLPIFPVVLERLRVENCDEELKAKCMSTVATFIEFVGQDIQPQCLEECIQRLRDYLNSAATCVPALKALAVIFGWVLFHSPSLI